MIAAWKWGCAPARIIYFEYSSNSTAKAISSLSSFDYRLHSNDTILQDTQHLTDNQFRASDGIMQEKNWREKERKKSRKEITKQGNTVIHLHVRDTDLVTLWLRAFPLFHALQYTHHGGVSILFSKTTDARARWYRSRSPGRFTHRGINASGSCSGERGNVLGVGNYCYVAVCSAAQGPSAPTGGGEGRAYRGGRSSTACSHQLCALKSRVVRLINISSVLRHCCLGDRKCMRPVKRFFSGRPMTVTG